ncbi:FecR family protein [Butyricimonas virosa]|jgi:transmembrane sensor|uniref:DUF4974 domain-containing protein n=1 Tax=Butyricimonas virosa TaxID=544645 RepID=A0A415QKM2_9BACT|nr:FecR domain-containing protein [Butyricimonas virosa]RHM44420.1 DUF4974 domain-containing protein [Butyricimonas virosa]
MNLLRRRFKIAHLIAEEFAGVITKENQARLEQWRVESPAHAKEYDEIRTYIMTGNEHREKGKQTVKNEWRKFERVYFRKYVIWKRIGRCVAIMVIPLLVCGYFVSSEWKSSEVTIIDNVEIVPGTGRAQLIMADGRFLKLEQKENMKLDLPGVKIVATEKKIVYRAIEEETSTPKEEEYNTLVVPRGGEYMVELSDGTKVWLNSDSELRFPITFVGDRRNVEIEGEAYFEVAKDEGKPFHVLAKGVDIKVLGTSFNVMTYRGRTITTLVEGKVCLTYKDESVLMVPDRQAEVIAETGKILMREVDARNFTLWKDGVFYFENAALETIAERLSQWYDVNIVFNDEALKKLRYSVEMKRYNNIQDLLTKIEKTQKVKFLIQGKSIYIHKWLETYDLLE